MQHLCNICSCACMADRQKSPKLASRVFCFFGISICRYIDVPKRSGLSLCFSFAFSLCLCGSSFLCSLLGGSSEFCCGCSTFLGDSGSFCLVGLYLLGEKSLRSGSFLVRLGLADLACLGIFLSLPSIETALSLFLAECAFGYTALQVFAEQYAFVGKDSTNGVGGLGTNIYPIECTLKIEDDCCRVGVGVERTETLDDFAVTRRAAVSYYDVVESIVFVTMTSQTNFCCHWFVVVWWALNCASSCPGLIINDVLFTRKSVQRYNFFVTYTNFSCTFHFFFVILHPI